MEVWTFARNTGGMSMIKDFLTKLPLTSGLRQWYGNKMTERQAAVILGAIERSPYEQGAAIAQALRGAAKGPSEAEREDIQRIEAQRAKYLANTAPLVDGSLGEGGPYDIGVTVKEAFGVSKSPRPAQFLYMLVRALRPQTVIELGTNTGISSAFIASALKRNGQGRIRTLEGSPYRLRLAKQLHADLGLTNVDYTQGLFVDTLDGALAEMGTVDLAFIDGHHQYQPTLDYFDQIFAHATPKTVFLFDDIRWSDGMLQAWTELQADARTGLAVDLTSVGLTTARRSEIPGDHVMDQIYSY